MKKVFLVDIIGTHSGMHYYDSAFVDILLNAGFDVCTLSNYSAVRTKHLMLNFFCGMYCMRILKLLLSLFCLLCFILLNRKSVIIYLSFGGRIDLIFLRLLRCLKNHIIVDIHEYVSLDCTDRFRREKFDDIFAKIPCVIIHSDRIKCFLEQAHYNGTVLYVPHFKYIYDKEVDISNISDKLLSLGKSPANKILFFGHIRKSKGIDVFIDAIKHFDKNELGNLQFIIAGNDPDRILPDLLLGLNEYSSKIICISRYIEDNELNYIFSNVDYVVLPYKEISQSGILETSIYFRKRMILSDLPYFRNIISLYPSFGSIFSPSTGIELCNKIKSEIYHNVNSKVLYSQKDLESYYKTSKIKRFVINFTEYIKNENRSN